MVMMEMNEEVRYNYTGYRVYFDKKGKVHRYKENDDGDDGYE